MKTKYRFSHVSDDGKTYYWESGRICGDSRVVQIKCSKEWFWNPERWAKK